jgi:hypothetical protein
MLAEFEKFQIVNVINGNLVDHNMKGIEYVSCFETRHLISFLNVDCLDPAGHWFSYNRLRASRGGGTVAVSAGEYMKV